MKRKLCGAVIISGIHKLEDVCRTPRVKISYFFTSHDHIHHVRIQWGGHPLLLFSDPKMVDAHRTEKFRDQASHVTHQQHLQMGLRKGMAILIYHVVGDTKFQAVLLADDSVVGRGGKGENRLWKRITPIATEFGYPRLLLNPFAGLPCTERLPVPTMPSTFLIWDWKPNGLMRI